MARRAYGNAGKGYTEPIAAAAPPVYNTLLNKYYVDEGYDYVFTGRRKIGSRVWAFWDWAKRVAWFDSHIIDGAVNAAGWMTRLTATISSWWDKWIIDGIGVNGPAISGAHVVVPGAPVRMGTGAVVRAGHDCRAGRVRVLLRVSVNAALSC